jgi:L-ascorbate metabolism protein UlaG (beta-lactamase superfamily)
MLKFLSKTLYFTAFFALVFYGQMRGQDWQVIPIEHASAVIKKGDFTLYIDPVGSSSLYANYPAPDLILITDIHGDHYRQSTLDSLDTSKAKIIVPQAVADRMPASFTPQIDVLGNGESKSRFAFTITAIPMYNLREEALKFHPKGRGNGYVVEHNGSRLYISGDTEDIPEMRQLKNIDLALVCMNLPYTMTVESAAEAVLEFKPKVIMPYHYRGNPNVSDVMKFAQLIKTGNPGIELQQLDWYPRAEY